MAGREPGVASGVLAGDVLLHYLGAGDVGGQLGNLRAVCSGVLFPRCIIC